jgi:hypothetical protein
MSDGSDRLAALRASILASKKRATQEMPIVSVEETLDAPATLPVTDVKASLDESSEGEESEAVETQILPPDASFAADTLQADGDAAPEAIEHNVDETATNDFADVLADVDEIAAAPELADVLADVDEITAAPELADVLADVDEIAGAQEAAHKPADAPPGLSTAEPTDYSKAPGAVTAVMDRDVVRAEIDAMRTAMIAEAEAKAESEGTGSDVVPEDAPTVGAFPEEEVLDQATASELEEMSEAESSPDPTLQAQLADLHSVKGTPLYMSPEQCLGGAIEPPTDVYALGVMMYELLEGTAPYLGSTMEEVVVKHLDAPVPKQESSRTPEEVKDLIARMLSKKPHERPTADQIVEILQRQVAIFGEEIPEVAVAPANDEPAASPMVATPPPADHTLDSADKKRQRAIIVVGVLILVLIVATVGITMSGGDEGAEPDPTPIATPTTEPQPVEPPSSPQSEEPAQDEEPAEMAFGIADAGAADPADASTGAADLVEQPAEEPVVEEPVVEEPVVEEPVVEEPVEEPVPEVEPEPDEPKKPVRKKRRKKRKKKKVKELRMEL